MAFCHVYLNILNSGLSNQKEPELNIDPGITKSLAEEYIRSRKPTFKMDVEWI